MATFFSGERVPSRILFQSHFLITMLLRWPYRWEYVLHRSLHLLITADSSYVNIWNQSCIRENILILNWKEWFCLCWKLRWDKMCSWCERGNRSKFAPKQYLLSLIQFTLSTLNTPVILQIPRFRIVRSSDGEMHAEFLVVVSVGSHSIVTFGLWRRHSDFSKLALKVRSLHKSLLKLSLCIKAQILLVPYHNIGNNDHSFIAF
jgi:hypothetical protein